MNTHNFIFETLGQFFEEDDKIAELENGTEEETISLDKFAALIIYHAYVKNVQNAWMILKETIPLGNPLLNVDFFIKQSLNSKEQLLKLHKLVSLGLKKKGDTAFGILPNNK